jgi:hypothetical protein
MIKITALFRRPQAAARTPVQAGPTVLDPKDYQHVSGGSPRGTWQQPAGRTVQSPRGTW